MRQKPIDPTASRNAQPERTRRSQWAKRLGTAFLIASIALGVVPTSVDHSSRTGGITWTN